ncbi:prophage antirepressor-like protein [Arcanobacterium hippocoleae]|uniref:Prophage antirepressor-like protein n=1 Tax=Arcanobacterium hippocoleae TaxID=149017 RepID=A0ABU1T034_9ACTO|nr:prophage antirepressor-like protein [Arcanobacterium hippocoleae]
MANTALRVFTRAGFGTIRTIDDGGKVMFCGRDVATALGYENPGKAIRDHCKGGVHFVTPLRLLVVSSKPGLLPRVICIG